jgi:hypothetical protein
MLMTNDRDNTGSGKPVGESRRCGDQNSRWRLGRCAVAVAALSATLSVLPMNIGAASSSSLGKVSIITGSVSECGVGPSPGLRRPFTVTLHVRSNGRAVAIGLGTYYLTTSETTSPPPRGNIVVRATSKNIIEATIATVCQ